MSQIYQNYLTQWQSIVTYIGSWLILADWNAICFVQLHEFELIWLQYSE